MHVQGFRMKVVIDSHVFAVARYSVNDETPDLDVSNSEGFSGWNAALNGGFLPTTGTNRFSNSTYGQKKASIELEQATLITNPLGNPFLLPFTVQTQKWVKVEIYINREVSTAKHFFPKALIVATSMTGQVTALQPFTMRLVSDGWYEMHSNALAAPSAFFS